MSLPVIAGSALLEGYDFIKSGSTEISFLPVLLGVIAAAISGYVAIRVMLALVKKANFKWFSLYLVCLSVLLLIIK